MTKRGVGVTVGDGRQTKFWGPRWIDGLILRYQVISAVPEAEIHNRVCDYWKMDMGWEWNQISPYLPSTTTDHIV